MITSSDGLLGRVESHEQLGVLCGAVQEGAKTANSCLVAGREGLMGVGDRVASVIMLTLQRCPVPMLTQLV